MALPIRVSGVRLISVDTESARRNRLKDFLIARRTALSPEQVGLRKTGRRRTPGLRREEVAALSGMGVTWYTRLEQGRDIRVSVELLRRLARALQLSASDESYLFSLTGRLAPVTPGAAATIPQPLQWALDAMIVPAFVMDAISDVLAFNDLANAIYEFDADLGPRARNHLWRIFMDPKRRELYVDWEDIARLGVSIFRANYVTHIGDPAFEALIEDLQRDSAVFARLWKEQRTTSLQIGEVRLKLGKAAPICIHSTKLAVPDHPDTILFVLVPVDAGASSAIARLRKTRGA
jgi:transcriptional regulator with XRE-family HTH domain